MISGDDSGKGPRGRHQEYFERKRQLSERGIAASRANDTDCSDDEPSDAACDAALQGGSSAEVSISASSPLWFWKRQGSAWRFLPGKLRVIYQPVVGSLLLLCKNLHDDEVVAVASDKTS